MSAADEALVNVAYTEMRERLVADLEYRIRERDAWIKGAPEGDKRIWLKMREKGIPDRAAERDAYRRLADEIRGISQEETP